MMDWCAHTQAFFANPVVRRLQASACGIFWNSGTLIVRGYIARRIGAGPHGARKADNDNEVGAPWWDQ